MTISDKEFLEFLNGDSLDDSIEARLRIIIDEELEKPETEMEPELIEYCLYALNNLKKKG